MPMIGYVITAAAGLFAVVLVVQLVVQERKLRSANNERQRALASSGRVGWGASMILLAGLPRIFPSAANSQRFMILSMALYAVGLAILLSGKRRDEP